MTEDYAHIAPEFRDMATKGDADRIAFIVQDRWISHPQADGILNKIGMAHQTHGRARPASLLVVGESGIGKTMLRAKYQRDQRVTWNVTAGLRRQPVVSLQMPPEPLEADFFEAVLETLGAPRDNTGRARARSARTSAVGLLRMIKAEMLMLDEIQNVFAGTARQQRIFLNNLRWLINELRLVIAAFGTVDALDVFTGDEQLQRRFQTVRLGNWRDDLAGFKQFVMLMQRTLPLRQPGELATGDGLKLLLDESQGITSTLTRLIEEAAIEAIHCGAERVSVAQLRRLTGRSDE